MAEQPILAVEGIVKRFQDNLVLRSIDLSLAGGEMLGLIGANGAGKSTLVKIICGILPADGGTVRVDGKAESFRSVADALAAGIAVAHQHVSIILSLNGAQNIMLGREPLRGGLIDRKAVIREATALATRFGVSLDLRRDCSKMTVGEQKILDILKAVANQPRVLILDEPTASLTLAESRRLFTFLHDLRRHGIAILLISHHLREVAEECGRVAILKDGQKVHDGPTAEITIAEMARLMVGRTIQETDWTSHARPGEAAIDLRDLHVAGLNVPELLVRRGEVVGIAGVLGAGQTELLERLAGLSHLASASAARIGSLARLPRDVTEAVANAIFLIPDNRAVKAMLPGLCVAENIAAGSLPLLGARGLLTTPRIMALGRAVIARLGIVCAGPGQAVTQLSGGNQQKVAFGRWVARLEQDTAPDRAVFLLDNPTEGVDVGAKADIYALIRRFAEAGAAVLVTSTDFAELAALCERVYCIRDGAVAAQVERAELSEDRLLTEAS